MTTGINYGYCADDFMMKYDKYRYAMPQEYSAATPQATTLPMNSDSYASGIQNAGFSANTCTDGKDDGKIGVSGVLLNLGEGILKGAWNGVVGAVTDSNGNFSLSKTLTSVALVGACVAFPALGAIACGIGAIAGGSQVIKGLSVALDTDGKSDAEVKAAWENIGEGGSTVVGCALGAKASVGAMKSSASLTAIDDIVKSTDDLAKMLGNTDDIAKNLDDTTKLTKLLKSKGIDNADEIIKANKNGFKSVDEIVEAVSKQGKMSKLSQVKADDSLQGVEKWIKTAKAFADDAISSSKNNGAKIWNNAKKSYTVAKEVVQYKNTQRKYNKIDLDGALTEQEMKIVKEFASRDAMKSDDANKILNKIDEISNSKKAVKNAKAELKKIDKTKIDSSTDIDELLAKSQTAQDALDSAKSNTPFGKLTSSARNNSDTYRYFESTLKPDEQAKILKNIKNIKLSDVAKNLGSDGQKIFAFLQQTDNTYAQAVQQFGYDNVMEVLKVAYAIGQENQVV